MRDAMPVRVGQEAVGRSSMEDRRDAAFKIELEMAIAYSRQLLYRHPNDPFFSPVIEERRADAAKAILDYVWALMAERAVAQEEALGSTPATLALRAVLPGVGRAAWDSGPEVVRPITAKANVPRILSGHVSTGLCSNRLST